MKETKYYLSKQITQNIDNIDQYTYTLNDEQQLNKLLLGGMFGIITETSNILIDNNDLININNFINSNQSNIVIKNNNYNLENINSAFGQVNNNIFIDCNLTNQVYRNHKFLNNSFINFPNLTINLNNIDTITTDICSSPLISTYFIKNNSYNHYPTDILQLSPKLYNNGNDIYWSNNTTNFNILTNLEFKIETLNDLIELKQILLELPKNLNGNSINIIFNNSIDGTSDCNLLEFNNFFGGFINIKQNNSINIEYDTQTLPNQTKIYCNNISFKFNNCSYIIINNLSLKNTTRLNDYIFIFNSCKRVNISYLYLDNQIQKAFKINNSSVIITNSLFNFNNNTFNEYKGDVIEHSKVFIDNSVYSYKNNEKINNNFKKFNLSNCSMCTWVQSSDNLLNKSINVSAEFTNSSTAAINDNIFIGNHSHINTPLNFNINEDPTSNKYKPQYNEMPAGSLFYWPRAFLVRKNNGNITTSNSLLYKINNNNYVEYASTYFQTYNPNSIEYDNSLISGSVINNYTIKNLIPFVSGAISLDYNSNWKTRWSQSNNTNPLLSTNTATLNTILYNKDIKFDTTLSAILKFDSYNYNTVGPSIRTERADAFGTISSFTNGLMLAAGSTHNWGGLNLTPYYKTNNCPELPPPHNEFWLCRQGLHVVYKVADSFPEYLEYGYLKFKWFAIPPTDSAADTTNWYGTFLIADNYERIADCTNTEPSTCGSKWPKVKHYTYITYLPHGKTRTVINSATYSNGGSTHNCNCPTKYDPADIPLFGNYFLKGQGEYSIPLNKIKGKYLIFGIRGTYTTNKVLKDNGANTNVYDTSTIPMGNVTKDKKSPLNGLLQGGGWARMYITDFTLIPNIMPYLKENTSKWNIERTIENQIKLQINSAKSINLRRYGTRYYINKNYVNTGNNFNEFNIVLDKEFDGIISDTILCYKTNDKIAIADRVIPITIDKPIKNETYAIFLKSKDEFIRDPEHPNTYFNYYEKYQRTLIGYNEFDEYPERLLAITGLIGNQQLINSNVNNTDNINISDIYISGKFSYINGSNDYNKYPNNNSTASIDPLNFKVTIDEKLYTADLYGECSFYNMKYNEANSSFAYLSSQPLSSKGIYYKNGITMVSGAKQWYFDSGYNFHLLINNMLENISLYLDDINSKPVYYGDFGGSVQYIKYNMGIPSAANVDLYNSDADCLKDSNIKNYIYLSASLTNRYYQPFGIVNSYHIPLRKSKGFCWPLVKLSTKSVNDIRTMLSTNTYDVQSGYVNILSAGYFSYDSTTQKISNELITNLNSFNQQFGFLGGLTSDIPKIWNIPWNITDIENCYFSIKNGSTSTPLKGEEYYSRIKYPSAITSYFANDSSIPSTYYYDSLRFFNFKKIYEKYTSNNNNKLLLTISGSIVYGIDDNTVIGLVDNSNTKNITSDTNIIFNTKTISSNDKYNIRKDIIISGFTNNRNIIIIDTPPDDWKSNTSSDTGSENKSWKYMKLRDITSEPLEIPVTTDYIYTNDADKKTINYSATYTFKNIADFVLFMYYYKHEINHYLIKLNKLVNSFKFIKNDSNKTVKTHNDLLTVLNDSFDYVNCYTYSELHSFNALINDSIIWKEFPYDTNTTIENTLPAIISPFGTMSWTNENNQSTISRWNPTSTNDIITNSQDDTRISGYNKDIKHMLSIYRPFYIEYLNMFNTVNYTNRNDIYDAFGFKYGFVSGVPFKIKLNSSDTLSSTVYTLPGTIFNFIALNRDYGWENNDYSFESIVNANINNNGLNTN